MEGGQQEGCDRIELVDGRIFERYFQPQFIENQIIGNFIAEYLSQKKSLFDIAK